MILTNFFLLLLFSWYHGKEECMADSQNTKGGFHLFLPGLLFPTPQGPFLAPKYSRYLGCLLMKRIVPVSDFMMSVY